MITPNISIIALRILPGCRDYIRKCLKEGVFYYLNTNYEISRHGDSIKQKSGYIESLDDSFFNINDNQSFPGISISAIVGKNGDGKSTLVELMIRIINNFACNSTALNPNGQLTPVIGVSAELYYVTDNKFFRIRVDTKTTEENHVLAHEYLRSKYQDTFIIGKSCLRDNEITDSVFYTLVTNYSHFAYNTEEYGQEAESTSAEGHWLRNVFHKNDAYQTPLNIHPYRDRGNIDVNRERLLSTQRLLLSIIGSFRKNENGGFETSVNINGKMPYELKLQDIGYSKLQNFTLLKFLTDNQTNNIIDSHVEDLKEYYSSKGELDYFDNFIYDVGGTPLNSLSQSYLDEKAVCFFKGAIQWLGTNNLIARYSDLGQLVDRIARMSESHDDIERVLSTDDISVWKEISRLSGIQFMRLALVYDICQMWIHKGIAGKRAKTLDFDPSFLFKDYEDMSNADKCHQYIIYKTIEIFNTYPSYGNIVEKYASVETFFSFRGTYNNQIRPFVDLTAAFEKLSKDWKKKSHNTLKLRQAYSLLRGYNSSKELYASVNPRKCKSIIFERLNANHIRTLSDIETLPPPIFKWEINFRRRNEENLIPFSSFSSGEKQKLFFLSAILYHLRNINSIGDEKIHYHSVNLIFEEIELYFHPEWQRTMIYDLIESIRNANLKGIKSVNMIFVTHSPYILSDIPKSNVLFLKEGMPNYEMQENTFGANINSLLKNGFFLPSLPIGEFAYRKINSLFQKLHSGDFNPKDINQVYSQIMTVGEPAIRTQLMTLFAPYRRLILSDNEIREIFRILPKQE